MRCWLLTWSLCLAGLLAARAAAPDEPPLEFGGESGSGMLDTGELGAGVVFIDARPPAAAPRLARGSHELKTIETRGMLLVLHQGGTVSLCKLQGSLLTIATCLTVMLAAAMCVK